MFSVSVTEVLQVNPSVPTHTLFCLLVCLFSQVLAKLTLQPVKQTRRVSDDNLGILFVISP